MGTRNNNNNSTVKSGVVSNATKTNNVLTIHSSLPRKKDKEREEANAREVSEAKAYVSKAKNLKSDMETYHKLKTTANSRGNMDMGVENTDAVKADREKTRLMKLYNVSSEDFDNEYKSYSSQKTTEAIRKNKQNAVEYAKEHPVLASAKSVGNNLLSSIEGVANTVALLQGGKLDTEKDYISSNKSEAQREGAKSNIKSDIGKKAYDLGMSAADMGAQTAIGLLTGGGGTVMGALQGAQTANDMSKSSLKRGNSSVQAGLEGLGGGLVTAGLTKWGVDDILGNNSKSVAGALLRGARNEGLEEGAETLADTFISNKLSDKFNGRSEKDEAMHDYKLQGMTNEQAEEQYKKDKRSELLQSVAAGALFGGVLGGGNYGVNKIKSNIVNSGRTNTALNDILNGNITENVKNKGEIPVTTENVDISNLNSPINTKAESTQTNTDTTINNSTTTENTTQNTPSVEDRIRAVAEEGINKGLTVDQAMENAYNTVINEVNAKNAENPDNAANNMLDFSKTFNKVNAEYVNNGNTAVNDLYADIQLTNRGTGISRKDTDNIIFRTSPKMNQRGTIQIVDDIVDKSLGRNGKVETKTERAELKKAIREFAEQGNAETYDNLINARDTLLNKLPETSDPNEWATREELTAQIQSIIDTPEIASNMAVENMKSVVYDPNTSVDEKVKSLMDIVTGNNNEYIYNNYADDLNQAREFINKVDSASKSMVEKPAANENQNEKMKFKLWDKPVSDEFQQAVDALNNDPNVDNDEINRILYNTPEIQEGLRIKNDAWHRLRTINNLPDTKEAQIGGTSLIPSENRVKLRDKITNDIMNRGSARFETVDGKRKVRYDNPVRNDRRLDIVIGLPASGKSSAIVDDISATYGSRLHDNDEIKKLIPEFQDGWGAGLVHEESSKISDALLLESLERGENIVLPKVGSLKKKNPGKQTSVETFIQQAKEMGYEVYVHNVELPRNKAKARMMGRFASQGRFFQPDMPDVYFDDAGNSLIEAQYERLKQGGLIDGYSKWSNDVPKGANPELIESNITGNEFRSIVSSKSAGGDDSRTRSVLRGYTGTDIRNNENPELEQQGYDQSTGRSSEIVLGETGTGNSSNVMSKSDMILNPKNIGKQDQSIQENSDVTPNVTETDNNNATGDLKERSFPKSVDIDENLRNQIDAKYYSQLKNKDTIAKAEEILNNTNSLTEAKTTFDQLLSQHDPASVVLGKNLADIFNDNGDYNTAVAIIDDIAKHMTRAGQFTQAAYITALKNNPMAVAASIKNDIAKINEQGRKQFGNKWKDYELTESELKKFSEIKEGDTKAISDLTDEVYGRMQETFPHTVWEHVYDLAKNCMLLNPRTQTRNAAANLASLPLRSATDRVKWAVESLYKKTKNGKGYEMTSSMTGGTKQQHDSAREFFRSEIKSLVDDNKMKEDSGTNRLKKESQLWKDNKVFGKQIKNFSQAVADGNVKFAKTLDNWLGGKAEKYASLVTNAETLANEKVTGSILENLRQLDYWLLGDVGDMPFVEQNFTNALANYMNARDIKNASDCPPEAVQMAIDEALKATFKDDNFLTRSLSSLKNSEFNKKTKLIDVIMPFTKTPANLAMRGIDYSPAGFAMSINKMLSTKASNNGKLSNTDISNFIGDLSKNITGTGMIIAGYLLAKAGMITGGYSDDKNEKNYQKLKGFQPNAFHIGGKYYTYDWAQPSSIPLLLGQAIYEGIQNDDKEQNKAIAFAKSLKNGTTSAIDAWFNLSPLQSVAEVMGGGDNSKYGDNSISENLLKTVTDFPQALIPSALGATARTVDPTIRNTYDKTSDLNTYKNQVIAKIPGLSKDLPAAYDTWGRERKRSGNSKEAAFAQYVNPGTLGYDNPTEVDDFLQGLFERTGEGTVFPRQADYKVKINGKDKQLNNKEYSERQKVQGQKALELVKAYKSVAESAHFTDAENVDFLSDIYSAAKQYANKKLYGIDYTMDQTAAEKLEQGPEAFAEYLRDKAEYKKYGYSKVGDYIEDYEKGGQKAVDLHSQEQQQKASIKEKYGRDINLDTYNDLIKQGGQKAVKQYVTDKNALDKINEKYDTNMSLKTYQQTLKDGGKQAVENKAKELADMKAINEENDLNVTSEQYSKWSDLGATKEEIIFMSNMKNSVKDMKENSDLTDNKATLKYLATQNISNKERSKYILLNSSSSDWESGYKARGINTFGASAAYQILANREIATLQFDADNNGRLKQSEIKNYVDATFSDPDERAKWYYVLTGKNY